LLRKLVVLVGTRKALAMAVKRVEARRRVTSLRERLAEAAGTAGKTLRMPMVEEEDYGMAAEEPPQYGARS